MAVSDRAVAVIWPLLEAFAEHGRAACYEFFGAALPRTSDPPVLAKRPAHLKTTVVRTDAARWCSS